MFNSKHYIPILKWKPAEQQALEKLTDEQKKFVSPLIQIVMPNPKKPKLGEREKAQSEQLDEIIASYRLKVTKIPEDILSYWGKTRMFIDFSLVYTPSLRVEGLTQALTIGKSLGLFLIPVVNLSSDEETIKVASAFAKADNTGICLRLVCADFTDFVNLSKQIQKILKDTSLTEEDIDILVDLKETYKNEDKYIKYVKVSQNIPNLTKWRTFIFASGAFPVDLNDCELGENHIPRLDWNDWINQLNSKDLLRHPSFADYTIQHPIYNESARFFSPSASIRYTLSKNWLVMRGQKGQHKQYLANARLLSEHSEFFGDNFSFGDGYIKMKGADLNSDKTGNATNWLTAGVSHHLSLVVSQISNLP